jgi:hypothetical protein
MSQQFQFSPRASWRGGHGERLWLSALVEAMDRIGQPARRAEPCDALALRGLQAQLALPVQSRFGSPLSSRN